MSLDQLWREVFLLKPYFERSYEDGVWLARSDHCPVGSSSGVYFAEIWYFHLTEAKLPGGQFRQ
jgi:hypothetical protein